MSSSTNLLYVDPNRVEFNHFDDFATIGAHDDKGNTASLFFHPDRDGEELDNAETWLTETLLLVQQAKVAQAKKQWETLPFAAIGEPIDLTDVQVTA